MSGRENGKLPQFLVDRLGRETVIRLGKYHVSPRAEQRREVRQDGRRSQ